MKAILFTLFLLTITQAAVFYPKAKPLNLTAGSFMLISSVSGQVVEIGEDKQVITNIASSAMITFNFTKTVNGTYIIHLNSTSEGELALTLNEYRGISLTPLTNETNVNQEWKVIQKRNGLFAFENPSTSLLITAGPKERNSSSLYASAVNSSAPQYFRLWESTQDFAAPKTKTRYALFNDAAYFAQVEGKNLTTGVYINGASQNFEFQKIDAVYYNIFASNGKVLAVDSTEAGSAITFASRVTNHDEQLWKFVKHTRSGWAIVNKKSGLVLTIPNTYGRTITQESLNLENTHQSTYHFEA